MAGPVQIGDGFAMGLLQPLAQRPAIARQGVDAECYNHSESALLDKMKCARLAVEYSGATMVVGW